MPTGATMASRPVLKTLLVGLALTAAVAAPAAAQGRIVCWKDKTGKVVGCGDTVPPEYQDSATKELDKRGVTRKTTESVDEAARRRGQAEEAGRAQAEKDRRAAELRRQDAALLATYANEQEIDAKRDRDLQALDLQLNQLRATQNTAADRQREAKARLDAAAKGPKPPADALKDELTRASDELRRIEQAIVAKDKEKDETRARYAEYRKRYTELKSGR